MKEYIDFIIKETDDTKIILHFDTLNSHVHGFTDKPPETWQEVYKIYYSYSIIEYWKDESIDSEDYKEIIYDEPCDECSILHNVYDVLSIICESSSDGYKNTYDLIPFGYGTIWRLSELPSKEWEFQLFQSCRTVAKGCQFILNLDEMKKLKDTIEEFLDYTLEHSEGI